MALAVEALRRTAFRSAGGDTWDVLSSLLFQVGMGGALLLYLRGRGVSVRALVGRVPRGWRPWALVAMAPPLLLLSLGTAALQYSVLATLAPGLAAEVHDTGAAPGTLLVLGQALAGVLAAAMEELLFRGVLLARWERRWGAARAAVASSLAFGLLHMDLLGAFVFALVMAGLYLRTRSLWVPILCHALNNAAVALSDLGGADAAAPHPGGPTPDWASAALAIALALPALAWFFWRVWPRAPWRLPYHDGEEDGAAYS